MIGMSTLIIYNYSCEWTQFINQISRRDQETKSNGMLYKRNTSKTKRKSWTKNLWMENNILYNGKPKTSRVPILFSDKVDFEAKQIRRDT